MNTLAHIVIASAALSRLKAAKRNRAVMAGAFLPDLSMFVFFAWSRLRGWSGDETWNVQYWTEPWQTLGAGSNSFVVFSIVWLISVSRRWSLVAILAAAALIHIALDFPLHGDDAHRHFWPLSDWRFASPISYWDPSHNGIWGGLIETLAVLVASALLWTRFSGARVRIAIAAFAVLQIAAFGVLVNLAS